ncbi:MAG: c-type cytochrome [Nitrospirota bacterium]|nr:MAG: c-type cytochrome [Nitrospirota bacterium]
MHVMFKVSAQTYETKVYQFTHSCIALTIGLILFLGSCTAIKTPPSPKAAPQEQTNDTESIRSQEKEAPPRSDVTVETPPIKETPPAIAPSSKAPETDESLAKGKSLYQEHCANCHGIGGDGKGPLAADLSTKPQNFTKGEYKFRSTMSGELPTDADLFRTITVGIPGTAMESYQEFPQSDRMALVAYLKSLSPRFLKSPQGTPIIFPVARPQAPESVTHGLQLYEEMQCSACHGAKGRGDGELAKDLTDTAGKPIQPADLTRQRLKSGDGPKAIYRTIMTGLDGTPMPSYGYSLDPEKGWDLALYIYSLATTKEPL